MRIKAELWDKIQYLFRNYYDRMMHAVFYLDGTLDEDTLKESLMIMIDKVPVLKSRYIANIFKPYWKVEDDFDSSDVLSLTESDEPEKDLENFITGKFESDRAPQIRVKLIRSEGKDILAFLVNHQCFDGADYKQFIYKINEVYNDLINGGQGNIEVKCGDRSNGQVYSTMSQEDKAKAKSLYKNISITKHPIVFPLTEGKDDVKALINKFKLSADTFKKMKDYGKKYDATVNDMILTAYFRSLYNMIKINDGEFITIPCMTDLRRHIEGGESYNFTNLTCIVPCTIDCVGKSFNETLIKVRDEMKRIKADKNMGLYGIPLLELAYKIAPSFLAEIMIKIGYTNPYIGMSNIGIIDDKKTVWGGISTFDAFMTGAIKYKPYMQLALTTFKGEITFTIAIYGNGEDKKIVEKFFGLFDKEIKSVIV